MHIYFGAVKYCAITMSRHVQWKLTSSSIEGVTRYLFYQVNSDNTQSMWCRIAEQPVYCISSSTFPHECEKSLKWFCNFNINIKTWHIWKVHTSPLVEINHVIYICVFFLLHRRVKKEGINMEYILRIVTLNVKGNAKQITSADGEVRPLYVSPKVILLTYIVI